MVLMMENHVDVSAIIAPGVYILRLRGRVVFVGAAKKPLVRLYAHANWRRGEPAPSWLPTKPIAFDSVEIRSCRVEELDARLAMARAELGWESPSPRGSHPIDWPAACANG